MHAGGNSCGNSENFEIILSRECASRILVQVIFAGSMLICLTQRSMLYDFLTDLCLFLVLQCMFAHSLRKFSVRDWSIEQKWMSVLLPLLLLYNGESARCCGSLC